MRALLCVTGLVLALGGTLAHAADKPLKVGTNASFAKPLEVAVEEAKKQGLAVELIEFNDPVAPNLTLSHGEIDVNYFQHALFLDMVKQERKLNLEPYADGIYGKTGLYSKKYSRLEDIPKGARVALAGDPVNFGRGLKLLHQAGLIKLREGVDVKASLADVIDNPKQLKILEVDFHQLPLSVNDVDLAQGFAHFLIAAKTIDPHQALLWEPVEESKRYGIKFVIRPESRDDPRLKQFVQIYQQSPVVRAALDQQYGDLYVRVWEQTP